VRFETAAELRLFADSVRGAVGGWEPPREPDFGTWWDEHDEGLAVRLAEVGWDGLWTDGELLGAAAAGGFELGRALAPLSLVDGATLGAALGVAGRARHVGASGGMVAHVGASGVILASAAEPAREATLDGTGTVLVVVGSGAPAEDGEARLRTWSVATLGYLAGLAARSLEETTAYVTTREQFGAPLAALPTMQGRLADMALAVDGLELVAWEAVAGGGRALPSASLRWATAAAREVTASAHQAHGGVGFALETGVHRAYRRAKSVQVWVAAVLDAVARG
jgi:uncharacterized membrane protein (UPF0136 family)